MLKQKNIIYLCLCVLMNNIEHLKKGIFVLQQAAFATATGSFAQTYMHIFTNILNIPVEE